MEENLGLVGTLLTALLGGGAWLIKYIFEENKKLVSSFIELQKDTLEIQKDSNHTIQSFKESTDNLILTSSQLREVLSEMISIIEENTEAIIKVSQKVDLEIEAPKTLDKVKKKIDQQTGSTHYKREH